MELNSFLDYITLFIIQYVPNGLIYILAGYALAKKAINVKLFLLSSAILSVFGFAVKLLSEMKLLNTSNTLPQILILLTCIFLLVNINKIKIGQAILSSLSVMILQVLFEGLYVIFILQSIFGLNIHKVFDKSLFLSSMIGLPYIIALGILVLTVYKVMMKRRTQ